MGGGSLLEFQICLTLFDFGPRAKKESAQTFIPSFPKLEAAGVTREEEEGGKHPGIEPKTSLSVGGAAARVTPSGEEVLGSTTSRKWKRLSVLYFLCCVH